MNDEEQPDAESRVKELLEIERICDQFEDRVCRGQSPGVAVALGDVPLHLRARVQPHLMRIASQANEPRSDDRPTNLAAIQRDQSAADDSDRIRLGAARLCPGAMIDEYTLVRHLGSGGTANVWLATDRAASPVAIKISDRSGDDALERLHRELETAARLQHDQIVRVRGRGVFDGLPYLVSDYVDGESMAVYLKRNPSTPRQAARWMHEITEVIAYAHGQGVIHRDLKPHNVLVDSHGQLHLTDFGLAKELTGELNALTKTGEILGTPAYMAPEQASGNGKQADARTDIYSLGVMLFRMLTGDVPFRGDPQSVVYQILHVEASSPRSLQPSVPAELDTICAKCIEKLPVDRFQTADELRDELARFLDHQPIRCRPATGAAKVRKWAARNRRFAGSLALSFVLLVTITLVSVAAAVSRKNALRTERELRTIALASLEKAERFAAQAKREAELSRQTQGFLTSIIEASDPIDEILVHNSLPQGPPTLATILGQAERRIRVELKDQPGAQAHLMDTLGNACRAAGMFDEADGLLRDAAAVRSDTSPQRNGQNLDLVRNRLYQARLMHDVGQHQAAWERYDDVISDLREMGSAAELERATALFFFGKLQLECAENDAAASSFSECLEIRRRRLAGDSVAIEAAEIALGLASGSVPEQLASLLRENDWAATIAEQYFEMLSQRETKDYGPACQQYAGIVQQLTQRIGAQSLLVLLAKGDYAGLLHEAGDYVESERVIRDVLDQVPAVALKHPQVRQAQMRLAYELQHAGRMDEAGEIYQRLAANYQSVSDYPNDLTLGLMWTEFAGGKMDRLLEYASALTDRQGLMAEQSAWFQYTRARVCEKLGRPSEAQDCDAKAFRIARSIERRLTNATWLTRMALIHTHHDELQRSEHYLREAIRVESKKRFSRHPRVARYKAALAGVLEKQGRHHESLTLREETLQVWIHSLPQQDVRIQETRRILQRLRAVCAVQPIALFLDQ